MFLYVYRLNEEINLEKIEDRIKNYSLDNPNLNDVSLNLFLTIKNMKIGKINNPFPGYKFIDQHKIYGSIDTEDSDSSIPFNIRLESKFIFLETSYPLKKVNTVKILNYFFDKNIVRFIPFYEDEYNWICKIADEHELKFFFDGEIIHDEDIEQKYCKKELNDDYSLFEAYLKLKHNDTEIPVYYYGDAIQFPPRVKEEEIEYVLQTFENTMTGNYPNVNKGRA